MTNCKKSRGSELALAFASRRDIRIESAGAAAGYAQRFPILRLQMLRQKDYLADVVAVVGDLPIDRLQNRVALAANEGLACEVGIGERIERGKHAGPPCVPHLHQLSPGCGRRFELAVAIAIRFLAVGFGKAGPARAHVPRHMLHDLRDRVHLRIERGSQVGVGDLRDCSLAQPPVMGKERAHVVEVAGCELESHTRRCTMPHMRSATLPALLVSFLVTIHAPAQVEKVSPLQAEVAQIAAAHHGQVSVFAKELKTGQTIALKADEPVQTASVIKLGLLYEAMEQIRAGKAHWDDKVVLTKDNQTNGSGVLGFFDTPATLTLKDVLSMMVITSDNTATNVAIDKIGLDAVNAEMGKLGLKNTWLYKKVGKPATGPMPADQKKFGLGKTTAREMATLMERIVTCQLGDDAAPPTESDRAICGVALHMLRSQFYRDGVPRYLEPVDSSEEGSAIANKTGALDAVRNDVDAIATKNGLLILSIFTWDNKDQSWTDDNEAYLTTAKIAKAIVNTWSPDGLDVKAFELPPVK